MYFLLLQEFCQKHSSIVVAGCHYIEETCGRIAVCPIFVNGERHDIHKLKPSPFQLSIIEGDSLCSGTKNFIFKNTEIGNFAVLICSDFLSDELVEHACKQELDFLVVPSCQKDSSRYFLRFDEQVKNSESGMYALFPNLFVPKLSEGSSGVVGVVDDIYITSAITRRITDANPKTKLWEASTGNDFIIADFCMKQKKPLKVKSSASSPNVTIKCTRLHTPKSRDVEHDASYKLIAFDLDGTLVRGIKFSWVKVWEHIGDHTGQKWMSYLRAFKSREISYNKWCHLTVNAFKQSNVTKEQIITLAKKCYLTHNLREAILRLKDMGFIIGIISGGIDVFLDVLIEDHEELFDFVHINRLLFRGNGKLAGVEPTAYDFEGKFDALELECEERGYSIRQAIFVGDQFNDEEVLMQAGHSIVYSENRDPVGFTSHKVITEDNLHTLVDYIQNVLVKVAIN